MIWINLSNVKKLLFNQGLTTHWYIHVALGSHLVIDGFHFHLTVSVQIGELLMFA